MTSNFSTRLSFDGTTVLAVFVPQFRTNGMYYEVNVKTYPRFYMAWSPLGRYDIVPTEGVKPPPYALILAASDAIESMTK